MSMPGRRTTVMWARSTSALISAVWLLLIAGVVLAAGCAEDESPESRFCVENADCDSGYVCRGGVCVQAECVEDSDCKQGFACDRGVCVSERLQECIDDDCCVENAYCRTTGEGSFCVCKENYQLHDGECVPGTRTVECANTKPENSSWKPDYEGGEITQTWDGEAFVPSPDTCEWECYAGYHEHHDGSTIECLECMEDEHCEPPVPYCAVEMNACVECEQDSHCLSGQVCYSDVCEDIPRTFTCSPLPGEGAEWNTVSEYEQEWDPESRSWDPEDSETRYNEIADDQSCRYRCIEGYRYNGEECEERPVCSTGDHLGASVTAEDLLAAMGICDFHEPGETSWGIVPGSAVLGRANWPSDRDEPSYRQYGVKTQFGTDDSNLPIFGENLAIISSGRARDAKDWPYPTIDDSYEYTRDVPGNPPADFVAAHDGSLPVTREGCPGGSGVFDSVNLKVKIRVPPFARGFSFDFRFFSQEYAGYTCSDFNDFFITMLDTTWVPPEGEEPIPADKNISFDAAGNYISVNSDQFFTVCVPKGCDESGVEYECPDGTDALADTGYPSWRAGATSWLTTTAPVVPGETITLRFIVWDTSDPLLDSLVLLDNFRWHAQQAAGPVTQPVAP